MSKQLIPKPIVFMIGILFIGGVIIFNPTIETNAFETGFLFAEFTSNTQEIIDSMEQPEPETTKIETPKVETPKEEPQPEPTRSPVQIPPELDPNDPPFFNSFGEELQWYSKFNSNPEYEVQIDGDPTCDDIIRFYKTNTQFEYRVILSKMVLEVCDFG